MLKEELRLHYSHLRNQLSPEALNHASIAIANQLLSLPVWSFDYYHLFLQIETKKEINTQYLLSILQGKDKHVVLPRVEDGNRFRNILLTDNTRLKTNHWGIPEPTDGLEVPEHNIDVVFLPLLAFDLQGHRVGYGKGFYDSFLGRCRKDVVKIGLSIYEAETAIADSNERDVSMDYCVTPVKIYAF